MASSTNMKDIENSFATLDLDNVVESPVETNSVENFTETISENDFENGDWVTVEPKKAKAPKKDAVANVSAQQTGSKKTKKNRKRNNRKKADEGKNKATGFDAYAFPTIVPLADAPQAENLNGTPANAPKAPKAMVERRKETPAEYRARHARLEATKQAREESHQAFLLREQRRKARQAYLDYLKREEKREQRRQDHEAYLEREAKRKEREAKREEYLEKKAQREEHDPRFHNGGGFGYVLKKGQTTRLGLQA